MNKIVIFFCVLVITSFAALADWGATRTITGNNVVLTVSPGDGFDVFTITETVTDATVESKPSACGLAGNVLTCDFEDATSGTLSYTTTGSGTVTGEIVAVNSVTFVSGEKEITGNSVIGVAVVAEEPVLEEESLLLTEEPSEVTKEVPVLETQKEICTPNWTCSLWTTCQNGNHIRACLDSNNCGTLTGKPAESQSCEEAVEEATEPVQEVTVEEPKEKPGFFGKIWRSILSWFS